MYRSVFTPENESELLVKLPKEYLRKHVEVIAFEVEQSETSKEEDTDRDKRFKRSMDILNNLPKVNMSDFKFDRDEANER
jgi:hypothetical protein